MFSLRRMARSMARNPFSMTSVDSPRGAIRETRARYGGFNQQDLPDRQRVALRKPIIVDSPFLYFVTMGQTPYGQSSFQQGDTLTAEQRKRGVPSNVLCGRY